MWRMLVVVAAVAALAPASATAEDSVPLAPIGATLRVPFSATFVAETLEGGNCCSSIGFFEGSAIVPLMGRVRVEEGFYVDGVFPQPPFEEIRRSFRVTFRNSLGSLTLAGDDFWLPSEPDPGYRWSQASGTGPLLSHVSGGQGTWSRDPLVDEIPSPPETFPQRFTIRGTLTLTF